MRSDESANVGDVVAIEQCLRRSRHTCFEVASVLKPVFPSLEASLSRTIGSAAREGSQAPVDTAPADTASIAPVTAPLHGIVHQLPRQATTL